MKAELAIGTVSRPENTVCNMTLMGSPTVRLLLGTLPARNRLLFRRLPGEAACFEIGLPNTTLMIATICWVYSTKRPSSLQAKKRCTV